MTKSTGSSHPHSALVIFAKAPIPGQVKTRLCPPLSPDEAASLHGSLVLDLLERSRDAAKLSPLKFDRFLACAPSSEHVFFKILGERHQVRLLDQVGQDLGTRMNQTFKDVAALGYHHILIVGTDVPTLPGSLFGEALRELASHDLVLGPTLDGGYYLIGLRQPTPELFQGIPWSTDQVLSQTQVKAATLGLKTALLPTWRDVDRVEDLLALIHEHDLEHQQGPSGRKAKKTPRGRPRGAGQSGAMPPPFAVSSPPFSPMLSSRTAGVLRLLATRLRARPSNHSVVDQKSSGPSS